MKLSRICISACLCLLLGCEESYQYPEIHESQLQYGVTMLHVAASQGQCRKIRQELARRTDVNVEDDFGETPLHKASSNGHLDAMKLLIKRGGNVNARNDGNQTPLNFSARRGSAAAVKHLVSHGAVINTEQNTPLNDAAAAYGPQPMPPDVTNQRIEIMKFFLDREVSVNGRGNCGFTQGHNGDYTPLHAAALGSSARILQLLIDEGAQVDATSSGGVTPLFHAALGGNTEAAKTLLDSGANVDFRSDVGITPLMLAVSTNNVGRPNAQTVKVLVDYGADVNSKKPNLTTSLHMAVRNDTLEGPRTVKILLEAGADIHARARSGRTPLSIAQKGHSQEIRELLESYASKSSYVQPQNSPQSSRGPGGGR